MNTDQVVEKILADAKAEAEEISQAGNAELAKMNAEAADKLNAFKADTDRLASEAADDKKQRMMAAARMSAAKAELKARLEAIDAVFEKAAEKVKAMDKKEYLDLMGKLMAKAVETGDEKILLAQGESKIDADFVKEINRSLGSGYKGNLMLTEEKCKGQAGFALQRGRINTNVTIDVLLSQVRSEIETEIANELFANA